MADGPALALQKALIAHLKADVPLSALVADRIYDEPPDGVTLPYVRLDGLSAAPVRMDGHSDTVLAFSFEAHSRPNSGRVEAMRIAEAITDALDDAAISPVGFTCDWCWFVTQTVDRQSDGKSYVATVVFEASLGT